MVTARNLFNVFSVVSLTTDRQIAKHIDENMTASQSWHGSWVNFLSHYREGSCDKGATTGGSGGQHPLQMWTHDPQPPTPRSKILEPPLPQYPPLPRLSHHQWPNLTPSPNFYSVVAPLSRGSCVSNRDPYIQCRVNPWWRRPNF